jgi:hypothetical protein
MPLELTLEESLLVTYALGQLAGHGLASDEKCREVIRRIEAAATATATPVSIGADITASTDPSSDSLPGQDRVTANGPEALRSKSLWIWLMHGSMRCIRCKAQLPYEEGPLECPSCGLSSPRPTGLLTGIMLLAVVALVIYCIYGILTGPG